MMQFIYLKMNPHFSRRVCQYPSESTVALENFCGPGGIMIPDDSETPFKLGLPKWAPPRSESQPNLKAGSGLGPGSNLKLSRARGLDPPTY